MKNRILSVAVIAFVLGAVLVACDEKKEENSNASVSENLRAGSDLGKVKFEEICASCHGMTGEGDGPAGASLTPKPRNFVAETFKFGDSLENIVKTIKNGSPGTDMVGYSDIFTEEEIDAVAKYVRKLHSKGMGSDTGDMSDLDSK